MFLQEDEKKQELRERARRLIAEARAGLSKTEIISTLSEGDRKQLAAAKQDNETGGLYCARLSE